MTRPLLAALAATLALGCSRPGGTEAAAPAAAGATAPAAAGRNRLVFFMNPNGRPCQQQDEVLRGMAPELLRLVDVSYVKTTEAADQRWFEQYGIRALPQLVVIDAAGREVKRPTPGILGPEQVRALVAN